MLPKAGAEEAAAAVRGADQVCPCAYATRGNVPVELAVWASGAPLAVLD